VKDLGPSLEEAKLKKTMSSLSFFFFTIVVNFVNFSLRYWYTGILYIMNLKMTGPVERFRLQLTVAREAPQYVGLLEIE
jgi:hypothetical protein